jgi:hypothetical protein
MENLSPKTPYDLIEANPSRVYEGPNSVSDAWRDQLSDAARLAANDADAKGGQK